LKVQVIEKEEKLAAEKASKQQRKVKHNKTFILPRLVHSFHTLTHTSYYYIHTMTDNKSTITKGDEQQNNGKANGEQQATASRPATPVSSMVVMAILIVLTIVTIPTPLQPVGKPSLQHVWYYGWITAISTGLGVLPLVFIPNLDSYWIGISNGTYCPSYV
jgi:hypothetical protein